MSLQQEGKQLHLPTRMVDDGIGFEQEELGTIEEPMGWKIFQNV